MLAIQGVQIARLERVSALSTDSEITMSAAPPTGGDWFVFAEGEGRPTLASVDGKRCEGAVASRVWGEAPDEVRAAVEEALRSPRLGMDGIRIPGSSSPFLWIRTRVIADGERRSILVDLYGLPEKVVKTQIFDTLAGGVLHDLRNQLTVLSNASFALVSFGEEQPEKAAACIELAQKGIVGAEGLIRVLIEVLGETLEGVTTEELFALLVRTFEPRLQNSGRVLLLGKNDPGELKADPWQLKLAMAAGVEHFRKAVPRGGTLEVALEATGAGLRLNWHAYGAGEGVTGPEEMYNQVEVMGVEELGANRWSVPISLSTGGELR